VIVHRQLMASLENPPAPNFFNSTELEQVKEITNKHKHKHTHKHKSNINT